MSDDRTSFFTVLIEAGGRMLTCPHKHPTRAEADACARALAGLALVEWVRDRRPQFALPWVREDL